jgi:uncharacterized membrane protein
MAASLVGTLEANSGGIMITALAIVAAIFATFATLRQNKQSEKNRRAADRAFSLHLRAIANEARR